MTGKKEKVKQDKVRFPIGAKLVTMISILLIIALGTITLLVTWFGSEDVQITAEENNRTVNAQAASSVESELSSVRANAFLLLDIINTADSKPLLFILSGILRLPPSLLPIRGVRTVLIVHSSMKHSFYLTKLPLHWCKHFCNKNKMRYVRLKRVL